MQLIHEIIEQLNLDNGSNYKMGVLKEHMDNELLKRVLAMTYDKVKYTYGITMKNISYKPENYECHGYEDGRKFSPLNEALDYLERSLCSRKQTGNLAIEQLTYQLEMLSKEDAKIIEGVLDRTQSINMGRSNINKVFKGLITKPPYQRCEIGTEKNILKNMDFEKGVLSEVKMDGTYRSCMIDSTGVTFMSRPGIEDSFPLLEDDLLIINKDFTLIGELTVNGVSDRAEANGMINSDNPPHEDIIYTVWDMIPAEEYGLKNGTSEYFDRFEQLKQYVDILESDRIQVVEHTIVNSMKSAYQHFQEVTQRGLEGTVIKSHDMKWKDGTSKQQLKVKLVIELDMRITGFSAGNRGSKNEAYFAGIEFENDEGTIKGSVGVTTLTEVKRDWFHENRDEVIGKVFELTCNDITKGRGNDFHALSHPRFSELRDKDETDTLERSFELKDMAMQVGDKTDAV